MVIDTNILIDYLNGDKRVITALDTLRKSGRPLFISVVTVAEMLALPTLAPAAIETVEELLSTFFTIALRDEDAREAAAIRRQYRLSLPDSMIAQAALSLTGILVTRDQAFKKVDELKVVELAPNFLA